MGRRKEGLSGLAVALVQLPVPDPDPAASRANVPLAAGYLTASFQAARIATGQGGPAFSAASADIRVIPRTLANRGGDAAILHWVRSLGPSLIGFSASMWNIQRNLWLAERIKAANPEILVLMGGPEIVAGAAVLDSPFVDSFVVGEGEAVFVEAIGDVAAGRSLRRVYENTAPLDLALVPDPYLSGAVEREQGDPLHLETMRGCAHHCSYCHYAKALPGLRFFPRERLREIFPWAAARGVPEIYLMDPSFTSTPGWEERLRLIASLNTRGIPLHAEIRLESVTRERAELFREAGFRSVEVGLQSTNARALCAVNRAWRKDAFARGAELLRDNGIVVKTGIILGLPEDTPQDFAATVDFLAAHGLSRDMEVYPLAVLPGTALRAQAASRGIRFMHWPPWEVLATPTMSGEELLAAVRGVQDRLGAELFPPVVPRFRNTPGEFIEFIDLRGDRAAEDLLPPPERLANSLTILVDAARLEEAGFLEGIGACLLRWTPHTLFQLVVASDAPLPVAALERAAEALHNPAHYFNQVNWLNDDPQGRFSIRLFRLVSRAGAAGALADTDAGEACETILRFHPDLLSDGGRLLEDRPLLLLEGPLAPAVERELAEIYRGLERMLITSDRPL